MCTYEDAFFKFNTGDELIDQLKHVHKGISSYMSHSAKARGFAEGMWLEDHINVYHELYTTQPGSNRVAINKLNNIVI